MHHMPSWSLTAPSKGRKTHKATLMDLSSLYSAHPTIDLHRALAEWISHLQPVSAVVTEAFCSLFRFFLSDLSHQFRKNCISVQPTEFPETMD